MEKAQVIAKKALSACMAEEPSCVPAVAKIWHYAWVTGKHTRDGSSQYHAHTSEDDVERDDFRQDEP
ncbi:hypothetical protein EIP86_004639 [Pleurotus ostreatoroseus]|nr:hypothetical protein EIP86_004639 [Pleurotus ostreatoroseus]